MEQMTLDEFEMKLVEFMHGIDFVMQDPEVQENMRVVLAEMKDMIPADVELPDIEPADLDLDLIHRIAYHLFGVEELYADIPAGASADDCLPLFVALRCGMFIYSWEAEK